MMNYRVTNVGPESPEDEVRQAEVFVLGRVLELLGDATGVRARPDDTWAAASSGVGSLPTEARGWVRQLGRIAQRVDLHCTPTDRSAAGLHEGPIVARIPGRVASWVVLLPQRGRKFEIVALLAGREQRARLTARKLNRFLRELGIDDASWLKVEPTLPLEPLGQHRLDTKTPTRLPLARLRAFVRLERTDLSVVMIYAVVLGALTLLTPVAVQSLVNTIAFGAMLQPLVVLTILLFAGLTFAAGLRVLDAWVVEVLQRRLFVRVATDFGRRLPQVRLDAHRSAWIPELTNRFFDLVTVQKAGATVLVEGFGLLLQTLIGLFLLAFYHPLLLALDAIVVVWLSLVVFVLGRGAVRSALNESRAKFQAAAWLEQVASNPVLFKVPGFDDFAAARAELLCRDYLGARKAHFSRVLRQLVGGLALHVFVSVALLGVGGFLVMQRELTLGQLVAAELVVTALAMGFLKVGRSLEKIYDLLAGLEKIGMVIDLPRDQGGTIPLDGAGPAELSLRGVQTGGTGSGVVMRDLDLLVQPGEHVSIGGHAGSGKSTLLETMAGLLEPRGGLVRIDGLDVRSADLRTVRRAVALVREGEILDGTVLENLVGPDRAPSHRHIREILVALDLDEAISALPNGLETRLLPSGAPLSRCQARRLTLARAMLRRPRLLLLDSVLDDLGLPPKRKARLLMRLFSDDAPWTAVVATRDPEVIAATTSHYFAGGGRLEEAPRHA